MTDIDNLTVGKAEIYFRDGVASPGYGTMPQVVSLGNIDIANINPDVSYVTHYKCVKGKKVKDEEFTVVNGLSINFTFDEINKDNLQNYLLGGSIDASASRMPVMLKEGIRGRAILRFITDTGTKFKYVIPKCVLKADGNIPLRSTDWVKGNMILDVLYHDTYHVNNDSSASQANFGYIDFSSTTLGTPF